MVISENQVISQSSVEDPITLLEGISVQGSVESGVYSGNEILFTGENHTQSYGIHLDRFTPEVGNVYHGENVENNVIVLYQNSAESPALPGDGIWIEQREHCNVLGNNIKFGGTLTGPGAAIRLDGTITNQHMAVNSNIIYLVNGNEVGILAASTGVPTMTGAVYANTIKTNGGTGLSGIPAAPTVVGGTTTENYVAA